MYSDLEILCIHQRSSVGEAVAHMDRTRLGIVLIIDDDRRLVGVITDGDVRRALLANIDLESSLNTILARKAGTRYAHPITAPAGADRDTYLRLLRQANCLHLPVVDDERRVVGLVTLDEFLPDRVLSLQAVIMAGGLGTRLHPLTEETPKPMLPVGDRPLMEIIIQQLRDAGIKRVNVTTHHEPEKISNHFGDGQNFGVEITYVYEDRPLGTAGGLGLMEPPRETLLVINGDILTQMDFRAMLAYHREHGAELTIAMRQYELQLPYGVIECEGIAVRRLTEKPLLNFYVNAGVYLLEPAAHRYIPNGEPFDMTDLIQCLLEKRQKVISFPIREYWLDIGKLEDYEQAQKDIKSRKL